MKRLALIMGLVVLIAGMAWADDENPKVVGLEIGPHYARTVAVTSDVGDLPGLRLSVDLACEDLTALEFPVSVGEGYYSCGFGLGWWAYSRKLRVYPLSFLLVKDLRIQEWAEENNKTLDKKRGTAIVFPRMALKTIIGNGNHFSFTFEIGHLWFKMKPDDRGAFSRSHNFYSGVTLAYRF